MGSLISNRDYELTKARGLDAYVKNYRRTGDYSQFFILHSNPFSDEMEQFRGAWEDGAYSGRQIVLESIHSRNRLHAMSASAPD